MISENIKQQLTKDGYVVLENVLSAQECENYIHILEKCCKEYTPHYANIQKKSDHGLDNKENEKIVYNLHNKDFSFIKLLDLPDVYPIIASRSLKK